MPLPRWIEPQLCNSRRKRQRPTMGTQDQARRLSDGRPHRGRRVKLLTRSGLDWTAKYPATAAAFAKLKVTTAYLDGELCGVRPDGVTSFELMQQGGEGLIYFAFDLLELDGEDIAACRFSSARSSSRLCSETPQRGSPIAITKAATARFSAGRHVGMGSKASSRSGSTARICPATVALGQDEMPQPRRVRRRRMVGSRRIATLCRRPPARLLRAGWTADLRGPRWHGHEPEDARDAAQAPPAAGDQENASRRSPASRQPVREAAGIGQGSLASARTGRRNHLSELAGRWPSSSHGFRRLARGQACGRGPAGDATDDVVVGSVWGTKSQGSRLHPFGPRPLDRERGLQRCRVG